MRFFYLIIFLYCGNVVFGQPLDSINLAEEVFEALEEEGVSSEIFLKLKLPKPDKGFFTNYKYNHFNELFPNEKMESLSFKTIKITKSQKVESLKDEYSTLWAEHFYHLNQNGRVSSFWEGKDYSAHYIWEADKLIKSRNDDHYGDKPFTNFSKYYEYSENEIHIISKGFDEENLIYKLNEEGKVIQLLAFDFREELVKKFNYTFNEDFNIIVAELYSYGRYEGIDTM
jgi:hypothetical protein